MRSWLPDSATVLRASYRKLFACLGLTPAAALALVILVSQSSHADRERYVRPGSGCWLPPSEEEAAVLAAARGDGKAALRLFKYYELYAHDHSSAIRWLRVGAKSGDLQAAGLLGSLLVGDGDIEGLYWLRYASVRGDYRAKMELKELEAPTRPERSDETNR